MKSNDGDKSANFGSPVRRQRWSLETGVALEERRKGEVDGR